jgi:carboxypeptidase C (cathepsin A)
VSAGDIATEKSIDPERSNFYATGDWMRSRRPALESVIDAGVRTILYAGDADYICNYVRALSVFLVIMR